MLDVFILTDKKEYYKKYADTVPYAKHLPYKFLTNKALREASKRSLTKHFFIISPNANVDEEILEYIPPDHQSHYVHVWGNIQDIALFPKDIKIPDTGTLSNNDFECVYHETNNIQPTVVILGKPSFDTNKIKNDFIVIDSQSIDEKALDEIELKANSQYIFAIKGEAVFYEDVDFKNILQNIDKYSFEYVHTWGNSEAIIFFILPVARKEINNGNTLYSSPRKIHENKIAFLPIEKYKKYIETVDKIPVIVIGNEAPNISNPVFVVDKYSKKKITDIINRHNLQVFYLVNEYANVKNFQFDYIPKNIYDLLYINIWQKNTDVMLLTENTFEKYFDNSGVNNADGVWHHIDSKIHDAPEWNVYTTEEEGLSSNDRYFIVLEKGYTLHDEFKPELLVTLDNCNKKSYWQTVNPDTGLIFDYAGLYFMPNTTEDLEVGYIREKGAKAIPYDIFFISYDEECADENYNALKEKIPRVKRIHGIKGIHNAHLEAAKKSVTNMFYVVDADAVILDSFDFSFRPRREDENKVYVWKSKNPVNNLVYGYGGVKLLPKKEILSTTEFNIDFTTSINAGFVPQNYISNITRFNTSPFHAWRSAFRECAKLAARVTPENNETKQILKTWTTKANKSEPYYNEVLLGARLGYEFGLKYKDNKEQLKLLNDYNWLKNAFKTHNQ